MMNKSTIFIFISILFLLFASGTVFAQIPSICETTFECSDYTTAEGCNEDNCNVSNRPNNLGTECVWTGTACVTQALTPTSTPAPLEIPTLTILPEFPCVFQDNDTCGDPEQVETLADFFLWLYNLGFWIVGLALFVALLWSGISYFLSGPNITKVAQAKERLTNVLLGFVLLLSAWLILNTINPDLVRNAFTLDPLPPIVIGSPGPEVEPGPIQEIEEEEKESEIINDNGNGGGNGGGGEDFCPAGTTQLGPGANNGAEFCDDFSFSHPGGDITIYCATGGGATSYIARQPPLSCPDSIGVGPDGQDIPTGETPRCTNISTYCLDDFTNQASFDTSVLNKIQEQICNNTGDSFTINLPAGTYYAGSHGSNGSSPSLTLACKP